MTGDLLEAFRQFRSILCLCPCCGEMSRLSDLRLRSGGAAPGTWLDEYEARAAEVKRKEEEFQGEREAIREAAVKRGRAKVPAIARNLMDPRIAATGYNPYDIKALLHPVEFVVFDGMDAGEIRDVVLLSKGSGSDAMRDLARSVAGAVESGRYDWKVARVSQGGDVRME